MEILLQSLDVEPDMHGNASHGGLTRTFILNRNELISCCCLALQEAGRCWSDKNPAGYLHKIWRNGCDMGLPDADMRAKENPGCGQRGVSKLMGKRRGGQPPERPNSLRMPAMSLSVRAMLDLSSATRSRYF